MTYAVKIYHRQGDGALVVKTGGQILPDSETQASAIADVSTATIAWTTAEKGRMNDIIAALEGVGILATS